jgi:hypothetical protein
MEKKCDQKIKLNTSQSYDHIQITNMYMHYHVYTQECTHNMFVCILMYTYTHIYAYTFIHTPGNAMTAPTLPMTTCICVYI